jgi:hypothetical protein
LKKFYSTDFLAIPMCTVAKSIAFYEHFEDRI